MTMDVHVDDKYANVYVRLVIDAQFHSKRDAKNWFLWALFLSVDTICSY